MRHTLQMGSSDGAHVLVQGSKRGKAKKSKKVLPIDIKFKDGLSGEEEPNCRAQASPCFSMSLTIV